MEYNVCDEKVLENCVERLRVLFSKENLQGLLSLLDNNLLKEFKEFEQEVAERLGAMLIQGKISNKEIKTICPKAWWLLLTASKWNEGLPKQVNFGKLIAQVLIWVINSMDGVSPEKFAEMLNIVSGFHVDSDSCRRLAMSVHSQDRVMGLTEDLRPELQIKFWKLISQYWYSAAETQEKYAQLPVAPSM